MYYLSGACPAGIARRGGPKYLNHKWTYCVVGTPTPPARRKSCGAKRAENC